jgi:hypothetical protein
MQGGGQGLVEEAIAARGGAERLIVAETVRPDL